MPKKIKVLIVEDSKYQQLILQQLINSDPLLEVMAVAENGRQAIEIVKKTKPDVITMDILMPGMNGFETIKEIMSISPIPIMVISAKANSDDQQISFKAIESGALAIIGKPPGYKDPAFEKACNEILGTLKTIAKTDFRQFKSGSLKPQSKIIQNKAARISNIRAIVIGASLGGPQALRELLSNVSSSIPTPIFIVQHISPGFSIGFAQWLDAFSILPVCIPKHGTRAAPGHIYLAPDNYHMLINKYDIIMLEEEPNPKAIKPSVTKLFDSAISAYGPHVIAILLTGMGRDGSQSLVTMKERGALTIAQDENSSLAFGMPGTAISLGGAKYIMPIKEIAPFLNGLFI